MYRLYVKFQDQKRFAPVDWNNGVQVVNLIYASMFTPQEVERVKRVYLAHSDNSHMKWEFRQVRG